MTLNGVRKEREKAVKETSLMISAVCKVNDAAHSVLEQIGNLTMSDGVKNKKKKRRKLFNSELVSFWKYDYSCRKIR